MAKYDRVRKNCAQLGGVHLMYILALERYVCVYVCVY